MIAIALLLAAQDVQTNTRGQWLIERHEKFCAMSIRLDDQSIVRIEYRPGLDNYHVLVSGGPYQAVEDGRDYQVNLASGKLSYQTTGRGVKHPDKLGTIYLQGRNPDAKQRPRWNAQSFNAFEQMLLAERPISISLNGAKPTTVSFKKSGSAFKSLANCSDLVSGSWLYQRMRKPMPRW